MKTLKPVATSSDEQTKPTARRRLKLLVSIALILASIWAALTFVGQQAGVAQSPPGGGDYGGGGYSGGGYGGQYEGSDYGGSYGEEYGGGYDMGSYGGAMGAPGMMSAPRARQELQARIAPLVNRLGTAQDEDQQKEVREELSQVLEDYFDRDLEKRLAEIASIEGRVQRLRKQCEQRKRAKEEILQLQLKVLENEAAGLGFFGQGSHGHGDEMEMGDSMGGMMGDMGGYPGSAYSGSDEMYMAGGVGFSVGPRDPIPEAFETRTDLDFFALPFDEVIDYLRDCSQANIYVDGHELKQARVDLSRPVTITAKDTSIATALELATASVSNVLGVRYEDGIAVIGLRTRPPTFEQYQWGSDGTKRSQEAEGRLNGTGDFELIEAPLSDVLDYLQDAAGTSVFVNRHSLQQAGVSIEAPVTIRLKNIKHRTALRLLLDSVDKSLYFSVIDGIVVIASKRTGSRKQDGNEEVDPSSAPDAPQPQTGDPFVGELPPEKRAEGVTIDIGPRSDKLSLTATSGAEELAFCEAEIRANEAKLQLVQKAFAEGQVGALDYQDARSALEMAQQRLTKLKREYAAKEQLLQLELRQAQLELDAAKATLDEHTSVNEKAPGTIPVSTIKRAELTVQTAELAVQRVQTLLDLHRKPEEGESP